MCAEQIYQGWVENSRVARVTQCRVRFTNGDGRDKSFVSFDTPYNREQFFDVMYHDNANY